MLHLVNIAYHLPAHRPRVSDSYHVLNINLTQAKIYERIYRLQSVPQETTASMVDFLARPMNALLQQHANKRANIKLIIYAHTSAITHAFGQSLTKQLQYQFNLQTAMNMSTTLNKCVASLKALDIAETFLHNQALGTCALILTGEIAYANEQRHIAQTTINGDAACAILVEKSNNLPQLINSQTFIDGRYATGIWMLASELTEYDRTYTKQVATLIQTAIKQSKMTLDDLSFLLPHNVNVPSWQKLARELSYPIERIFLDNIPRCAHTLGADVFINFKDAQYKNYLTDNKKSMMFAVGLGASYGYALWQH